MANAVNRVSIQRLGQILYKRFQEPLAGIGGCSLTIGNVTGQIEPAYTQKLASRFADHIKYRNAAPPSVRYHAGCGIHYTGHCILCQGYFPLN
jgi:hypothetical protein